jgi:hypothetical protein
VINQLCAFPQFPPPVGQTERFPCFPEIDHLPFNGPSDQLSRRTPPAIFNLDARIDASLGASPNLSRDNSIPAAHTALRKVSIFYFFVFSIF